jgi:hypothetical protein
MLRPLALVVAAAAALSGCASHRISSSNLERVNRPAFISRIEEKAGPRSEVFREDDSYEATLKRLDPKEADRRLAVKLAQAMTRFELSERLRVTTLAQLPRERPWMQAVDPARVASVLESFLVEEVPANAPDYELMRPLGADAVVELVIQEYGMRSKDGRAGAYVTGYGRLFRLEDGAELWHSDFEADQRESDAPHLDPYRVAKQPALFREALTSLLDGISAQLAQGLTPRGQATRSLSEPAASPPVQQTPAAPSQELPPGELPDPEPTPQPPVKEPAPEPEAPEKDRDQREPGTLP